jgi:hypothetical protein
MTPWLGCLSLICGGVFLTGCVSSKQRNMQTSSAANSVPTSAAPTTDASALKLAGAPEPALVGKVVMVSSKSRFAVLTFPVGQIPAADQRLQVYRDGLRVGEVKVGGRQRDDAIVADILAGDCQIGDEVWDR